MLCFSSAGWELPSQPIMVFVGTIKLENTFLGVTKSLATLARKSVKKKLTTCCSVKETERYALHQAAHKQLKHCTIQRTTARFVDSSNSTRQCCRVVSPFLSHGALQVWQSGDSPQPASSPAICCCTYWARASLLEGVTLHRASPGK